MAGIIRTFSGAPQDEMTATQPGINIQGRTCVVTFCLECTGKAELYTLGDAPSCLRLKPCVRVALFPLCCNNDVFIRRSREWQPSVNNRPGFCTGNRRDHLQEGILSQTFPGIYDDRVLVRAGVLTGGCDDKDRDIVILKNTKTPDIVSCKETKKIRRKTFPGDPE
jgi:hypothetical protein